MISFSGHLNALSTIASSIPAISSEEKDRVNAHYRSLTHREKGISQASPEYYQPERRASVIGVVIPENLDQLRGPARTSDWDDSKFQGVVQIAKFPFALGTMRATYRGRFKFDSSSAWEDVVIKQFMLPRHRSELQYKSQSENSAWARSLLDLYKKNTTEGKSLSKAIEIIPSRVIKVQEVGGGETLYNMERCLSGSTFQKWTNNAGSILTHNTDLFRFCAWSYEYTGSYLIVTDIQGMETPTKIMITDPAVLCSNKSRFGLTNQGEPAMQFCYQACKDGRTPAGIVPSPYTCRRDESSLSSTRRPLASKPPEPVAPKVIAGSGDCLNFPGQKWGCIDRTTGVRYVNCCAACYQKR